MGTITPGPRAPSASTFDDLAALLAVATDPAAHRARLAELRTAVADAEVEATRIRAEAEQLKADAQADREAAAAELAEAADAKRRALAVLEAVQGVSTSAHMEIGQ